MKIFELNRKYNPENNFQQEKDNDAREDTEFDQFSSGPGG
jgi:hypothetical protein